MKKTNIIYKIIVVILTLVLLGLVLYYNNWFRPKINSNNSSDVTVINQKTTDTSTKVKTDQTNQPDQANQKAVDRESSDNQPSPDKSINMIISGYNLDQTGNFLQVDAIGLNYVDNSGKCYFQFEWVDDQQQKITNSLPGSSSINCQTANFEIKNLANLKQVKVKAKYVSDNINSDFSQQVIINLDQLRKNDEN